MKSMKYSIGKSIIVEGVARYIKSEQGFCMHHDTTIHKSWIRNGKKINHFTIGCDHMDESGFCRGHEMTREAFIKTFCNGILPEEIN